MDDMTKLERKRYVEKTWPTKATDPKSRLEKYSTQAGGGFPKASKELEKCSEHSTKKTKRGVIKDVKNCGSKTWNSTASETEKRKKDYENKTQKKSGNKGENGMPETKENNGQKLLPVEKGMIPPTESVEKLKNSGEVILRSNNLVIDSANHLNNLMKRQPETIEGTHAACVCARQIIELMRVQMDAVKLARGLK